MDPTKEGHAQEYTLNLRQPTATRRKFQTPTGGLDRTELGFGSKYLSAHLPHDAGSKPGRSMTRGASGPTHRNRVNMREGKFLFVHGVLLPHHGSADGKEAAGRKAEFTKAWPNINPAAHGWAVMRAGRQLPVGRDQPRLAPWALPMTAPPTPHPRFRIYFQIAFQGKRALTPETTISLTR